MRRNDKRKNPIAAKKAHGTASPRVGGKSGTGSAPRPASAPKKPCDGALNTVDIARIVERSGAVRAAERTALPELLAPAGSAQSLRAAIAAGADAVYFGGGSFNARINAKNFSEKELEEAIALLHDCGKRAYLTLNTLVRGRETEDYLRFAERAYLMGVDALIVADLGGAAAIHRHLPELELHASTQMSGHNLAAAELLAAHGFSRMVCARELSRENLEYLVKNSPIEIEAFVHGALCVSHSGQCLFSSIVGGRSGNRGECAQPCRLPYSVGGRDAYPLSLKDLSLASHITELCEMGVSSLKLEGRMKSPEYVFGVTRAFRTLLDEGRNADADELSRLAAVFSRDGFTDGYYMNKIGSSMLGRRSEEQKKFSRLSLNSSEKIDEVRPVKRPITAEAVIVLGSPSRLTLTCGDVGVCAEGPAPERAINAPLSRESVEKSLSKLGDTSFSLEAITVSLDENEGVILPVSALNALRREACRLLGKKLEEKTAKAPRAGFEKYVPRTSERERRSLNSARFYAPEQITERARNYFDIIYLPLDKFSGECEGVIIPPVITDSERGEIREQLVRAREAGAKYALLTGLGALELVRECGLIPHGDFRLNVYNNESVAFLEELGIDRIMLSPELPLGAMRGVRGETSAIVYGRIPLMLLEKCVGRELSDCAECAKGGIRLTDRRGVEFPVLREYPHRNTVYNSAPVYMADRADELRAAGIIDAHYIFSVESPAEVDEVIRAYREHLPPAEGKMIRRM